MKTIITLTDTPDGGVSVQYMTQMNTEEIESGFHPSQSPSYHCAGRFHEIVRLSNIMVAEMRAHHAEMAEKAETERAKCLH